MKTAFVVLALAACLAVASAERLHYTEDQATFLWGKWQEQHNKVYADEAESR